METTIDFKTLKPVVINVPEISTELNFSDYLGTIKVRWGIGRDDYKVSPGLYRVGNPDSQSDVLISANYKLSFDTLRKNLGGLSAWILVIDTKGVNVWCAAGKGTFGTKNLVRSINDSSLDTIVDHHKIIVPQLGAPGVAAHTVKELTGFRVIYGPVRAKDIKAFLAEGYKATPEMRKVTFTLYERARLIPVDVIYRKYYLLIAILLFILISGIDREGFLISKMKISALSSVSNLLGAYVAGIVIAPLLLTFVPFRAFALKGAFWGIVSTMLMYSFFHTNLLETIAFGLINVAIASFMMMNFTGSSTFTSLSGVKKEMKWALPFQIAFASTGLILIIISKLI